MTTVPPVQKFPMEGFADTCTGFGRELHGTNEELGTGATASLCTECRARLVDTVKDESDQGALARRPAALVCPGGCVDHAHGKRYYDCICCYGD